jgi:hypothetical protein
VITIGANSSLTIDPTNAWTNLGSITLASGSSLYLYESLSAASLGSITNSGGTVYVAGTWNNSGQTLNGSASFGELALYGGTINGGIATSAGVSFTSQGGTLSGVTFEGPLNLTSPTVGQYVFLANGTTVVGSSGSGAGTINVTNNNSVYFNNTQTFNNVTINLASSYLYENDTTGAGTVLTLGSGVAIDESGSAQIYTGNYSGDGIVNQGAINQSGTGSYLEITGNSLTNSGTITGASSDGSLTIDTTSFTNSGTIDISNDDGNVIIEPGTFTNSGTLAVSEGGAVALDAVNFTNTGSITLASGAALILDFYEDASFTLAELGKVTNSGGTVYIQGTLDNTGGTLNRSSGLGQAVLSGGSIQGGTVTSAGLAFSSSGGTLSGVTFDGPLSLTAGYNDYVYLASGTTVVGSSGSGPGTINDTGEASQLFFDNTQTFNNATINLGSTSGNSSYLYENDTTGAGTVLTLGSGVAIDESGSSEVFTGNYSGDGIVNQGAIKQSGTSSYLNIYGNSLTNSGTITGAASDGTLTIDTATFTNSGTIDISNGETATIEPTTFTNLPAHTLTGGTYEAQAGSTIEIYSSDTITTDDATIILSGAGSVFETYNTSTGVKSTVDTTLRTIGASGELELLASRNWTTAGAAITNDGIIQLGGGTLTSTASGASLTDAARSTLLGFGTVTATTFANSGTIEASGGTLTLTDAVSGTGGLEIAAGATLVIAATAATTNTATFNGAGATLTLDHTGNLSGAIGGVGLDDIFDLVGVTANGASVNGSNQLVVTDNGTTVDTLQLSGNNSGFAFATQAVSGGTDVISLPIPATVADYEAYSSLYNQISGGFVISDTAANISAGLNSLNGSNINSISISDNNPVGVDVAQLSSDATAIGKLGNANGNPYQLAVTDSLPNIVGDLSALNGNSHVASLDATSGAATMSSGATVAAPAFTLTGSTTALTLSEILSYSGTFSADAGVTVSISKGDSLTLTGTDAFSSATTDGAGTLDANGTTTATGLTIGGTLTFSDGGTLSESGGLATSATLGDSAGDVAKLTIASTGT